MNNIIKTLSIIAKRYGIKKLVKVIRGDKLCKANGEENYINRSYICGNDRIELGIYEDEELMIASFFHEIGHIVDTKDDKYNSEEQAWVIGFELAKKHGYNFSENTYKWAEEQLTSYSN